MNRISLLMISLTVMGIAAISPAQEPVAKLYRVSSSNDVIITGISTDGLVTWSNEVIGTMARVEVADLATSNDWHTYTHVISTGHTGNVELWDDNTPEGFSFIPAGTFVMGSPIGELELWRQTNETPHQVTLTRNFFLARTELTNGQMADVLNWVLSQRLVSVSSTTVRNREGNQQELLDLDDGDCQISWNGSQLVVDSGKAAYPCIMVTWYGAQAYCNYLSDMEGLTRAISFSDWSMDLDANGYRLPTESEWEYACRAGTTTALYTGGITSGGMSPLDPNMDAAGWYGGNSTNPDNPMSSGKGTHPVGLKQANGWDLFDMHGNVWEWCWDWHFSPYPGTVTDPTGPASGLYRKDRGGGWRWNARECRSANRYHFTPPVYGVKDLGFRPARTVP